MNPDDKINNEQDQLNKVKSKDKFGMLNNKI